MDEKYMKMAIELAKKGYGKVNPNPVVGAVIVKDGVVISKGYHEKYGGNHAEINALTSLDDDLDGSTLYITLEPCCHYGKTPPCVEEIINRKISRIVIGSVDPNSLVSGNGIRRLKEAGIEVVLGVLEEACKEINEVFNKYIICKKPFVVLKAAMTLDGKISTATGESKWITDIETRKNVHQLRNKLSAIMVGVNTVIEDDSKLTCRLENGRNPIRIIVDSTLRVPVNSKVISDKLAKTIIATTFLADEDKKIALEKLGVTVLRVKDKDSKVDLKDLMIRLGELNIDGILLEGGASLNFSALEEKIVDKVQIYVAPKIIGGQRAKTPVGGVGIKNLSDSINLESLKVKNIGKDLLIEGYIRKD